MNSISLCEYVRGLIMVYAGNMINLIFGTTCDLGTAH